MYAVANEEKKYKFILSVPTLSFLIDMNEMNGTILISSIPCMYT